MATLVNLKKIVKWTKS